MKGVIGTKNQCNRVHLSITKLIADRRIDGYLAENRAVGCIIQVKETRCARNLILIDRLAVIASSELQVQLFLLILEMRKLFVVAIDFKNRCVQS